MVTLLRPVGPERPGVYWRRRALVLVPIIVLIGLIAWACGASGGTPGVLRSGASTTTNPLSVPTRTPVATINPPTVSPGSMPPAGGPGPGSDGGTASVPASTALSTSGGTAGGGGTGISTGGGGSTASSGPGGVGTLTAMTCATGNLAVQVRSDRDTYPVGMRPQFQVTVTNTGSTACSVDVQPSQVTLVVTSGTDRIWGSNDCPSQASPSLWVFQPGVARTLTVVWPLQRSEVGCPTGASAPPFDEPGTYHESVTVGGATAQGESAFVLG